MITYRLTSCKPPLFVCDQCRLPIEDDQLVLLRAYGGLPEERTYHVHDGCLNVFADAHRGNWIPIANHSYEAGWLV